MSSNLHSVLDNSEIHVPKDFDTAPNNSYLTRNQLGGLDWASIYFVEPVLNRTPITGVPPTEVSGDRYIVEGAGVPNPDWDGALINDIVEFDGSSWISLSAEGGMMCYSLGDASFYGFDLVGVWTAIGGGGGGIITAFTNQASNRLVFCDTVSNTIKAVTNMTNLGIMGLYINAPFRASGLARFDGNIRFDGQLAPPINNLGTTSGLVPLSFANGMAQKIELNGNTTMANPLEVVEGNAYRLIVYQDGVGGHTFSLSANYTWTGGAFPAIPGGAGEGFLVDMLGVSSTEIMATLTAFQ